MRVQRSKRARRHAKEVDFAGLHRSTAHPSHTKRKWGKPRRRDYSKWEKQLKRRWKEKERKENGRMNVSELPLYGTVEECPACGIFRHNGPASSRFVSSSVTGPNGETLDTSYVVRTCWTCNYSWMEKPLYMESEE